MKRQTFNSFKIDSIKPSSAFLIRPALSQSTLWRNSEILTSEFWRGWENAHLRASLQGYSVRRKQNTCLTSSSCPYVYKVLRLAWAHSEAQAGLELPQAPNKQAEVHTCEQAGVCPRNFSWKLEILFPKQWGKTKQNNKKNNEEMVQSIKALKYSLIQSTRQWSFFPGFTSP